MSKSKRFYFFKVYDQFIDSDSVRWVESGTNGNAYMWFYIKLCKLALNNDGRLVFNLRNKEKPYSPEQIAQAVRMDIPAVKEGLRVLAEAELISVLPDQTIYVTNYINIAGSETNDAQRKREKHNNISRIGMRKKRLTKRNEKENEQKDKEENAWLTI